MFTLKVVMFSVLSTWCLARSIPSLFHLKQHTPNICLRNIDDEWMVLLLFSILLTPYWFCKENLEINSFIFPLCNISWKFLIQFLLNVFTYVEGSGLQTVTPYDILYPSHPLRVIVFGTNRLFSVRGGQGLSIGEYIFCQKVWLPFSRNNLLKSHGTYLCLNQNTSNPLKNRYSCVG